MSEELTIEFGEPVDVSADYPDLFIMDMRAELQTITAKALTGNDVPDMFRVDRQYLLTKYLPNGDDEIVQARFDQGFRPRLILMDMERTAYYDIVVDQWALLMKNKALYCDYLWSMITEVERTLLNLKVFGRKEDSCPGN